MSQPVHAVVKGSHKSHHVTVLEAYQSEKHATAHKQSASLSDRHDRHKYLSVHTGIPDADVLVNSPPEYRVVYDDLDVSEANNTRYSGWAPALDIAWDIYNQITANKSVSRIVIQRRFQDNPGKLEETTDFELKPFWSAVE